MSRSILPQHKKLNVLILGATQGIGLGFVRSLLNDERVQRLFATYRNEATAGDLFRLQDERQERLTCMRLDVTEESLFQPAFQQIRDSVDELHFAVYCVGVLHEGSLEPEKSLRHIDSEKLLYSFHVNSVGAVLAAKYLASLFKRETPSIFAAISARVGSIGDNRLGGWYGYRASKAALNMLIKTTAIEYKRRCPSTTVVSLHPGTTDTSLSKPFQGNVPDQQLSTVDETVRLLSEVLSKVDLKDSGEFYSWDGTKLPW